MSIGVIVLLILLGLILVILEILVIPGIGIVGIIGGVLIIIAIYSAYSISMLHGNLSLLGSLILSVLAIYFSLKSSTWKNATLGASIDGKIIQFTENEIQIGVQGITVSRLANFGKAKINNQVFEVESCEGFVDVNVPIFVFKIEGNKIIVKPLNN